MTDNRAALETPMKNMPVLVVSGRTLAEAYENALVALRRNGVSFRTQYDRENDPPSLDATMNITVLEPMSDPMIHKAFPGGIEDLREYVMELQGVKDHWVKNINDPADTRWEYTYHARLRSYGQWRELRAGKSVLAGPFKVDQVERALAKLIEQPFTRQAQMIAWMPNLDNDCYDPPCLQSLWYRIVEDEDGMWRLNCNVRFRSNDAWGANFMNMFGFTMFNREVMADKLAERSGKTVELGRLNWHADSFHIYGKDLAAAEKLLFSRMDSTRFEDRVFNFHDPDINAIYRDAEAGIREKLRAAEQTLAPAGN